MKINATLCFSMEIMYLARTHPHTRYVIPFQPSPSSLFSFLLSFPYAARWRPLLLLLLLLGIHRRRVTRNTETYYHYCPDEHRTAIIIRSVGDDKPSGNAWLLIKLVTFFPYSRNTSYAKQKGIPRLFINATILSFFLFLSAARRYLFFLSLLKITKGGR